MDIIWSSDGKSKMWLLMVTTVAATVLVSDAEYSYNAPSVPFNPPGNQPASSRPLPSRPQNVHTGHNVQGDKSLVHSVSYKNYVYAKKENVGNSNAYSHQYTPNYNHGYPRLVQYLTPPHFSQTQSYVSPAVNALSYHHTTPIHNNGYSSQVPGYNNLNVGYAAASPVPASPTYSNSYSQVSSANGGWTAVNNGYVSTATGAYNNAQTLTSPVIPASSNEYNYAAQSTVSSSNDYSQAAKSTALANNAYSYATQNAAQTIASNNGYGQSTISLNNGYSHGAQIDAPLNNGYNQGSQPSSYNDAAHTTTNEYNQVAQNNVNNGYNYALPITASSNNGYSQATASSAGSYSQVAPTTTLNNGYSYSGQSSASSNSGYSNAQTTASSSDEYSQISQNTGSSNNGYHYGEQTTGYGQTGPARASISNEFSQTSTSSSEISADYSQSLSFNNNLSNGYAQNPAGNNLNNGYVQSSTGIGSSNSGYEQQSSQATINNAFTPNLLATAIDSSSAGYSQTSTGPLHVDLTSGSTQSTASSITSLENNFQQTLATSNNIVNSVLTQNNLNLNPIVVPSTPAVTPIIHKHIYLHVPPPEFEESQKVLPPPPPPKKHYKILFIKVPQQSKSNLVRLQQEIAQRQAVEDKTLIYVLVKNPEDPQPVVLPTPKPSEHQVFFVKYNGSPFDIASQVSKELDESGSVKSIVPLEPGLINGATSSAKIL